ncbi:MAG: LysE family translocator [Verrucomicrobia bacterium]|nr:LysE family translocator [Verrucomicrobiota bacterium]
MDWLGLISFFLVMIALAAMPSASVALVVARSSGLGLLNGVATIAGIVMADLIFIGIAFLGMTALALAMGSIFSVLKYVGGAYLIWLGIQLLRSRGPMSLSVPDYRGGTLLSSFAAGLLLTLGDLKAILFYASLFPALMDMTALTVVDIIMIASLTILTVGGVKLVYAVAAGAIIKRLGQRELSRQTKRIAGGRDGRYRGIHCS